MTQFENAKDSAGDFAERLLVNARQLSGRPLIKMREAIAYQSDDEFISYRHTIGAAIVLLLLGKRLDLQQTIIEELLKAGVQNDDGGWPIADRVRKESDILCSVHAAFFLPLSI